MHTVCMTFFCLVIAVVYCKTTLFALPLKLMCDEIEARRDKVHERAVRADLYALEQLATCVVSGRARGGA